MTLKKKKTPWKFEVRKVLRLRSSNKLNKNMKSELDLQRLTEWHYFGWKE